MRSSAVSLTFARDALAALAALPAGAAAFTIDPERLSPAPPRSMTVDQSAGQAVVTVERNDTSQAGPGPLRDHSRKRRPRPGLHAR